MEGIKDVAPKIGIAGEGEKAAAEAIKHTGGMAAVPILIIVGSIAASTAGGTMIGF